MFPVLLRRPWFWMLAAASALMTTHVLWFMFWSRFDQLDDSGYMLAILRGVAGGGRLYEDVFSQYGPFYCMAWLPWFRLLGAPIDHNHAGLGVAVLWILSSATAGWLVHRHTRSAGWTAITLVWATWSLTRLGSELAHPKSLVALLCALLLAALAQSCRGRMWSGFVLAGSIVAALTLTKINTGVFAIIAVVMGSLAALIPQKRLVLLAGLAISAIPFVLLRHAWEPQARVLLGLSVWISSFMTLQIATSHKDDDPTLAAGIGWSGARMFAIAFTVVASAILLVTLAWGTSAHALLDCVLLRPLGFAGVFEVPPILTGIEVLPLLASALFAIAWQIPSLRRNQTLWRGAMIAAVLAETLWDALNGWFYLLTAPALLWLAAAADHSNREPRQPGSRLWLTFAIQLAVWQSLSIFPVNGAQSSLPRFLSAIVFILGLRAALSGLRRFPARTVTAAFAAGVALLCWNAYQTIHANYLRHIPFKGTGAEWFHWRADQAARMNCVAENLKLQTGPVFTFHGQPSLALWSGKSVTMDSNRLHFIQLVSDTELAATLKVFADEPKWSAVTFADGKSFGGGKRIEGVAAWLESQTSPWLLVGEYQVRLKPGSAAIPPVCAAWQANGTWRITVLAADSTTPKKGRISNGSKNLASFKWEGFQWQPVPHAPGYVESAAPAPVAEALNKNNGPYIIIATTSNWKALFAFPIVQVTAKP